MKTYAIAIAIAMATFIWSNPQVIPAPPGEALNSTVCVDPHMPGLPPQTCAAEMENGVPPPPQERTK